MLAIDSDPFDFLWGFFVFCESFLIRLLFLTPFVWCQWFDFGWPFYCLLTDDLWLPRGTLSGWHRTFQQQWAYHQSLVFVFGVRDNDFPVVTRWVRHGSVAATTWCSPNGSITDRYTHGWSGWAPFKRSVCGPVISLSLSILLQGTCKPNISLNEWAWRVAVWWGGEGQNSRMCAVRLCQGTCLYRWDRVSARLGGAVLLYLPLKFVQLQLHDIYSAS